jgi:hypothetical protein
VKTVHFAHAVQEATLFDYLHEVEHQAERVARLEHAIDNAMTTAPERMRAVIEAFQALSGLRRSRPQRSSRNSASSPDFRNRAS